MQYGVSVGFGVLLEQRCYTAVDGNNAGNRVSSSATMGNASSVGRQLTEDEELFVYRVCLPKVEAILLL